MGFSKKVDSQLKREVILTMRNVQIRTTSPSFYGHEQLIEYQGAAGWGIAKDFSARGETDNLKLPKA